MDKLLRILTERELDGLDEATIFQEDWFCADFIAGDRLEGDLVPTLWMPKPEPPRAALAPEQKGE